jgi:hypothetical protein
LQRSNGRSLDLSSSEKVRYGPETSASQPVLDNINA